MKQKVLALALASTMLAGLLAGCTGGSDDSSRVAELENQLSAANSKIAELEANEGGSEGGESNAEAAGSFDASRFVEWFEEEGVWRTIENSNPDQDFEGGFVTDASGRPSDAEIEAMLHMASLAVTSGGKTDWFMVAVTDPDEQLEIIGNNYGQATSEGTVTVLVFGERLLRPDVRTDENNSYQPDRGYYDAGIVTGYLNVAAIALGYGSHMFMSPALPGVNGFNEGDVGLDASKYLEGTTYEMASNHETYSTENMKFVCAVVIGSLNEDVDPEAGVTQKDFPDNWIVWG